MVLPKTCLHSHVYHSTIYNSKDMESTQVSVNSGLDKENVVRIHMEYYVPIKITKLGLLHQHGCSWKPSFSANYRKNRKPNNHMFSLIGGD